MKVIFILFIGWLSSNQVTFARGLEKDILDFFLKSIGPKTKNYKNVDDILLQREHISDIKITFKLEEVKSCEKLKKIETSIKLDIWEQHKCDKLVDDLKRTATYHNGNIILVDPIKFDCRRNKLQGMLYKCP